MVAARRVDDLEGLTRRYLVLAAPIGDLEGSPRNLRILKSAFRPPAARIPSTRPWRTPTPPRGHRRADAIRDRPRRSTGSGGAPLEPILQTRSDRLEAWLDASAG